MGCSASAAVSPSSPKKSAGYQANNKASTTSALTSFDTIYRLGEKVGKGSYAQVHLATTRKGRTQVAVKVRLLHPENLVKTGEVDKVLKSSFNEVNVWKAIGSHVNCVQLVDSFFDDHLSYMVMEKCSGSLYEYFRNADNATEAFIGDAFQQILCGIGHMHSVNIVHRDIKPDNFLVGGRSGDIVKICDFGLSAQMPESGIMTGIMGTAPYMPPEMLATQKYDEKADVWSFGVVAYLILCGEFPYPSQDGTSKMMKRNILKGEPVNFNREWLSDNAIIFLQEMLERDPAKRPSASLVLDLPYFTFLETEGLPCLEPVLKLANTTGAFGSSSVTTVTETDVVIRKMEMGHIKDKELTIKSFNDSNVTAAIQVMREKDKHWVPSISEVSTAYGSSPRSSEAAFSSKASKASAGLSALSSKASRAPAEV